MIILRQKEFAFGGFDWAFDSDGKLRADMSEEDQRKFEAMKKKHPDEWKEFQRRGNKDRDSSSYSGGGYSSGRRNKAVDDYYKSVRRAKGITWGTWGASTGNTMIRKKIKNNRREEVDEKIGHDKRMKGSDRAEINQLKSKSSKTKKALQDAIDENKTAEERKKAAKKYIRREALDRASNMAVGGANAGANLGYVGGYINTVNKLTQDRLMTSDRSLMKGTLGGMAGGAVLGATIGGIRAARASKKTIERLRNSQDKKKAKDKVKVARGEMTESEFVEKHGGKEK